MKITWTHTIELTGDDAVAIARSLGIRRLPTESELIFMYCTAGRHELNRLIEHGKRGLQLDELQRQGEVEIGRAHGQ